MRKLALLMLVSLMVPGVVAAQCQQDGDPGFFGGFGVTALDVIAGELVEFTIGPANFGFQAASPCKLPDTFCLHMWDSQGWTINGYADEVEGPFLDDCFILNPGYLLWFDVSIQVPCDVAICDYDTVWARHAFCDVNVVCDPTCLDACLDPNVYSSINRWQTIQVILHVVESPPALFIMQDSIYVIEQGQTAAYVPFSICNGDPCAEPTDFSYVITSKGNIGAPINTPGTASQVPGGECEDVYGVIDAGLAEICDLDTLTIIAWDALTGTVYDTCVQLIHVVEPIPVPLFSTPVITILVLAMILSAAVIMRRRAASRA